jgi:hypothetical protein
VYDRRHEVNGSRIAVRGSKRKGGVCGKDGASQRTKRCNGPQRSGGRLMEAQEDDNAQEEWKKQ